MWGFWGMMVWAVISIGVVILITLIWQSIKKWYESRKEPDKDPRSQRSPVEWRRQDNDPKAGAYILARSARQAQQYARSVGLLPTEYVYISGEEDLVKCPRGIEVVALDGWWARSDVKELIDRMHTMGITIK
jgi:hypothetical protein